MISGPEVFLTVKEFESSVLSSLDNDVCHHEQVHGVQLSFAKNVKSLISAIEELGSPFMEDSPDLVVLDTIDIMPEPVMTAMRDALKIGQKQYDAYIKQHLEGRHQL